MIRNSLPTLAIAAVSLALLDVSTAQATSQTLDKIKEVGKITFGYREASIPFAYLGADQKPTGLSLDLCSMVADKIKAALQRPELGIEYVPVNASNRIPLLQNSTIEGTEPSASHERSDEGPRRGPERRAHAIGATGGSKLPQCRC